MSRKRKSVLLILFVLLAAYLIEHINFEWSMYRSTTSSHTSESSSNTLNDADGPIYALASQKLRIGEADIFDPAKHSEYRLFINPETPPEPIPGKPAFIIQVDSPKVELPFFLVPFYKSFEASAGYPYRWSALVRSKDGLQRYEERGSINVMSDVSVTGFVGRTELQRSVQNTMDGLVRQKLHEKVERRLEEWMDDQPQEEAEPGVAVVQGTMADTEEDAAD